MSLVLKCVFQIWVRCFKTVKLGTSKQTRESVGRPRPFLSLNPGRDETLDSWGDLLVILV